MKLTPEDQSKLRDKELANIIRKLNGGKTLTAREEAKLAAATAGGQIDAQYVGTWDELAAALGKAIGDTVTRRAIQDWRNDPRIAPEIEKRRSLLERADGRHCVPEWLKLMVDLRLKRGKAAAEAADDPENDREGEAGLIQPPRYGGRESDWTKAKVAKDVERKSIEIDTLKGALLETAELEVSIGAMLAAVQTKLSNFPARVARFVVGLRDVGEVEDKLRDEIDADLGDLQRGDYLAENAVRVAVAALPFDAATEALCEKLLFAGADRTALLDLAGCVAAQALRQIGRRTVAGAQSGGETSDAALSDPATGQVTDEATARELVHRSAAQPSIPAVPPPSAPPPAAAPKGKTRKRKTRPKPTPPPGEIEAVIQSSRKRR